MATGEDQPAGTEGELWIQGPQVMQGYLNNAAATRATIDAEGWLKTGDIGCFDEDGYLYIRDRVKELIKVKGFQVPPAEVEAALMTHEGVAEAAVIGVPDDEAGEIPMAFVVPADGSALTLEDLQEHLSGRLASYTQILRLQLVESIPTAASGKILRRVLREAV
jgi:4-coumarate--CoA ligase